MIKKKKNSKHFDKYKLKELRKHKIIKKVLKNENLFKMKNEK